ncbi:MAG: hypothetical protein SH850_01795 [Planctomycetaceae bacterium]|nr:hypothetical protein [Planctomycetaceae bacterium]
MLFLASVSLVVLLPVAWSYYGEDRQRTGVSVASLGDEDSIADLRVDVHREPSKDDSLVLEMQLKRTALAMPNSRIQVIVPKGLRLAGNSLLDWSLVENTLDDVRYVTLRPKEGKSPDWLRLSFAGAIMARGASVDFQLALYNAFNGVVSRPPTTIGVTGLSDLELTEISPAPDERSPHALRVLPKTWDARAFDHPLTIRGTNRSANASGQFQLFVVATLIGVMVSVVVSILQSVLLEFENLDAVPSDSVAATASPVPQEVTTDLNESGL